MDLSKAFDCLPHDVLLSKLSTYDLKNESVQLLNSYLSGRKQQVKLNQSRTNGPINAYLTIAQVMPRYNHNNEKQEALL